MHQVWVLSHLTRLYRAETALVAGLMTIPPAAAAGTGGEGDAILCYDLRAGT